MKFLSDENLPRSILDFLRQKKLNVKDIQEENLRGISDEKICQLAKKEKRVILTYDKDFLFPETEKIICSVIIFHFPKINPKKAIPYLEILLKKLIFRKIKPPFIIVLSQEKIEIIKE